MTSLLRLRWCAPVLLSVKWFIHTSDDDGTEAISYPHPSLEPALARTLGVPIFQEQIIRVAMSVANFSGGEAEELRRAMGFKRSEEKMRDIRLKLRKGMTENGIPEKTQEQIIQHISSFALYGFPESHSAAIRTHRLCIRLS